MDHGLAQAVIRVDDCREDDSVTTPEVKAEQYVDQFMDDCSCKSSLNYPSVRQARAVVG